jgi:heme-degrading monooxygenase HmoA
MVRATLHMKVKPGSEAEFESAWHLIAIETMRIPGNLRQALLKDPDEPSTFVVTSDWESREAFGRYERSADQDALTASLRSLRESASMTVYELLAHVDREAHE